MDSKILLDVIPEFDGTTPAEDWLDSVSTILDLAKVVGEGSSVIRPLLLKKHSSTSVKEYITSLPTSDTKTEVQLAEALISEYGVNRVKSNSLEQFMALQMDAMSSKDFARKILKCGKVAGLTDDLIIPHIISRLAEQYRNVLRVMKYTSGNEFLDAVGRVCGEKVVNTNTSKKQEKTRKNDTCYNCGNTGHWA